MLIGPARVTVPQELDEAISLLQSLGPEGGAIAGGTDMVVRMKSGLGSPTHLVDLSRIEELRGIHTSGQHLFVGALTTHSQIAGSELLARAAPILVQACRSIGSVQVRNRGTIGGNLANASPAGDTIPALYSLDALVITISPAGERQIPIEQFFIGPGKTALGPAELIKGVLIPQRPPGERSVFIKLGQRNALAISVISLAAVASLRREFDHGAEGMSGAIPDGSAFQTINLAYGAVSPTVIRARRTEKLLTGCVLSDRTIREAMEVAGREASPISDIRASAEYRRDMAGALLYQAVWKLCNRECEEVLSGR